MRDDITRLADLVLANIDGPIGADEEEGDPGFICIGVDDAKLIERELRALARTDHIEDKLGMVPAEANEWAFEDKKRMRGDYAAAAGWNACRDAMLAAAPAPDRSAAVEGMVVNGLELEYVMTLVDAAAPGPWLWSENGNIVPEQYTDDCEIAAVYSEREDDGCPINASAIIAAVNWLRANGRAMLGSHFVSIPVEATHAVSTDDADSGNNEVAPRAGDDLLYRIDTYGLHGGLSDADFRSNVEPILEDIRGWLLGSGYVPAVWPNSEKLTTSPERVQIPAESEHVAPYDRCPKCTAHMPVGQTCGGVNCGLRRAE